jgi:Arc/MetJ-type ribon-helix-helix transcriptional regulator
MTITLTSEQQKWLEAEVAAGRFVSVEEAVRLAVADFMLHAADLSWAKPYIDEAEAEFAAGKTIALDEFNAHVDRRLKALR